VLSALGERDFIGVRAELIRLLGGDANKAIVLTRIFWRSDASNRDAINVDGAWWWRTTYDNLSRETGLSVDQVRRAVRALEENGYIKTAKHRVDGISDQTRSYRLAIPTDDVAAAPDHHVANPPHLPSIKTEKTTRRATRLPASWSPTKEHEERARTEGLNLDREVEKFRAHADEHARTAKNWNGAFTRWLITAAEFRARVNTQRPGPRTDSQRMLDIMQLDTADTTLEQELFRQMNGDKR
jgi:DNA-binding transcriptional ArsR family regulator